MGPERFRRGPRLLVLGAALGFAACSHTRPSELTADEHRTQAAQHEQAAAAQRSQYDPAKSRLAVAPRTPFSEEPGPRLYNPTAAHLSAADRQLSAAFEHLNAAQQLERYEDEACAGLTLAQRTACPVLAPWVVKVEELAQGLTLHLKADAPVAQVTAQMQCHLAFSQAHGFDRAPCPLYLKGVRIAAADGKAIEVHSTDPTVAAEVRLEGRRLFGAPAAPR